MNIEQNLASPKREATFAEKVRERLKKVAGYFRGVNPSELVKNLADTEPAPTPPGETPPPEMAAPSAALSAETPSPGQASNSAEYAPSPAPEKEEDRSTGEEHSGERLTELEDEGEPGDFPYGFSEEDMWATMREAADDSPEVARELAEQADVSPEMARKLAEQAYQSAFDMLSTGNYDEVSANLGAELARIASTLVSEEAKEAFAETIAQKSKELLDMLNSGSDKQLVSLIGLAQIKAIQERTFDKDGRPVDFITAAKESPRYRALYRMARYMKAKATDLGAPYQDY